MTALTRLSDPERDRARRREDGMHYRQQEKAGGGIPAESNGRHKPTKNKYSLCFVIGLIKSQNSPGNPSTDFVGPPSRLRARSRSGSDSRVKAVIQDPRAASLPSRGSLS